MMPREREVGLGFLRTAAAEEEEEYIFGHQLISLPSVFPYFARSGNIQQSAFDINTKGAELT